MKKNIYGLSLFLTLIVLVFVFMKLLGFIFWINGGLLDKWMALIGLFAIPTSIYFFLKKWKVRTSKILILNILIVIIHIVWLWLSVKQQPYYYAYLESNQVLSSPYVIEESRNTGPRIHYSSNVTWKGYTLYKSVNSILFVKESVRKSQYGRLTQSIRLGRGHAVEKDGHIYIETDIGEDLLVK
ncbi:hypothetical protein CN326_20720 [Bacillus sp. AFS018417]|uniref:hypothetical protein n=1 Tax=Bacillus sp. AFS018417 TaxID=2033491 RepID=UPI000BF89C3B|nr:hypothetical protein [Bacillus sp. AFS018417]PEZ01825.1 hypothetical protein CN326_20720 [Bacillus sp. AFS018417]